MSLALQILRANLKLALEYQIEKSKEELRRQGHYASGRLERSFEAKIVGTAKTVILGQILAEQYGEALDTGVPSQNIRYNPRVLLPWLRIVRSDLNSTQRLRLAFAIKAAHKREGMPTRNSMRFSTVGRRTGWKEASIKAAQARVDEVLNLDRVVDQLILEAFDGIRG